MLGVVTKGSIPKSLVFLLQVHVRLAVRIVRLRKLDTRARGVPVLQDSTSNTPFFFILSPGADPVKEVRGRGRSAKERETERETEPLSVLKKKKRETQA